MKADRKRNKTGMTI